MKARSIPTETSSSNTSTRKSLRRRPNQQQPVVAFLEAAVAYYASLGVKVERVMTDNGSCYLSRTFGQTCKKLGLKHIRTKPAPPKTNGKAERFIQTSLREWAYARAYNTSDERTAELPRCVRGDHSMSRPVSGR
jgi:transposase InsO family protein